MLSDSTQPSVPQLATTTPLSTHPIDSFTVRLKDGRVLQVTVDGGEGFYREEIFKGRDRSFKTQQVFVANGTVKELPSFRKG